MAVESVDITENNEDKIEKKKLWPNSSKRK